MNILYKWNLLPSKFLASLTLLFAANFSYAQTDTLSIFEGNFSHGNFSTDLTLKVHSSADQPYVLFSSPDQNAYDIPSRDVFVQGDSIGFALQSDFYRYDFVGTTNSNDELDLVLTVNNENFPLILNEVSETDKQITSRDIRFRSGNLYIYGTIYYPEKANGKALYFVTSSGDQDRSATRSEAIKLAKKGYLTFHTDKRGTGMSDGNWQSASIQDLCSDDIGAITYLAESNQLRLSDIGIKGSSQGASKVPYILSAIPELGFGILVSCPGSSLLESDLNYWKNRNEAGLDQEHLSEATDLQRSVFRYIAGDLSLDSLRIELEKKSAMPWYSAIWIPDLASVQTDRKLTYSPLPHMENVSQPILIIQGEADQVIPSDSMQVLRNGISHENPNNKYLKLANADHSMMFKGESDFKYWPSLHPDYWPNVLQWLDLIREH